MRISIHVYLTDKRATARVVYVDPGNLLRCGIELDEPQNIWGVILSTDNWDQTANFDAGRKIAGASTTRERYRLRSLCVPDEMWAGAELLFHLFCRMNGAAEVGELVKFLLDSLKPFLSFAVIDLSFSSVPV